jgi:hypothetical protein
VIRNVGLDGKSNLCRKQALTHYNRGEEGAQQDRGGSYNCITQINKIGEKKRILINSNWSEMNIERRKEGNRSWLHCAQNEERHKRNAELQY